MHYLDTAALPLLARLCLVLMFPFSGLDKIVHWQDALKQAKSSFLPGGAVLLVLAITVEFVTPACILAGWHDRLAACVLAAFCVVTAVLYHPFWNYPGYWSKAGEGQAHFWDFLKNFGLVGGLLLLAIGGTPSTATAILAQPLASTPYMAR